MQGLILLFSVIFVFFGFWLMFGRSSNSNIKPSEAFDVSQMPQATKASDMISKGVKVEQSFVCTTDTINNIGIVFTRLQYIEGVNLVLELLDEGSAIARSVIPVTDVEDQHRVFIEPNGILRNVKDRVLTLKIYSENGENTGLALMVSESVNASYKFNHRTMKGSICFEVNE